MVKRAWLWFYRVMMTGGSFLKIKQSDYYWKYGNDGLNSHYIRRSDNKPFASVLYHCGGLSFQGIVSPDGKYTDLVHSPYFVVHGTAQRDNEVFVGHRNRAERMARSWVERTLHGK